MVPVGILCGVVLAMALFTPVARAFESDVHFGLTRWLALRAGFGASQADAIAIGDQRVDGGQLETLELDLEYACAGRFPEVAKQVQRGHYPAGQAVPAAPADRTVIPGSEASRRALAELAPRLPGKEGLMLGRFGDALHPLQDSWSHQGTPSRPELGASLACEAALASSHPAARGGPNAHAADLTSRWPVDVIAMARATYDELLRYPPIAGKPRQAAPWESLLPALDGFVKAGTKTQKRAWFVAQGQADTSFLGGISLPDGPDPGPLNWSGRKLPAPTANESMQHDAPAEVRAFFDRLLARWLSAERVDDVLADMGTVRPAASARGGEAARAARQLAARLQLWKLRDHGAAATLAHAPSPLSAAQLRAVDRLAQDSRQMLPPMPLSQAVFPLQPAGPAPMPLLPYIVRPLPVTDGPVRMIAIVRLLHAPYDTLGWIAERRGDRWVLVDLVASVGP